MEHDFDPLYVVDSRKKKVVAELKAALDRFFALVKSPVHKGPDFGLGLSAGLGDRPHEMGELIADDGFRHFFMGRGESRLGEHAVGGLVFLHMLDFDPHPEPVQGLFEERHLAADAGDAQPAQRMKDNPVAARGQIIFLAELRRFLDISHGFLAGGPESDQGLADLRALGPIAFERSQTDEHAGDPGIDGGHAQGHPDLVHRHRPGRSHEGGNDVRLRKLHERPGQSDLQVRGRRDIGGRAELHEDERHNRGDDEHDEDQDENQDIAALFHGISGSRAELGFLSPL